MPKRKKHKKAGFAPGTLIHIGEKKSGDITLHLIKYNQSIFDETIIKSNEPFTFSSKPDCINWLNIDGLHDTNLIDKIGKNFNIHPLALEDCLHTAQRPKADEYDDFIYIVLRMLSVNEVDKSIDDEQLSIILGKDFLISIQEKAGDIFTPVRDRIRSNKVLTLEAKTDFLAYSLIDAIVDNYFSVVDEIFEEIETIDQQVMDAPNNETLKNIFDLKRRLVKIRKEIAPLRDVLRKILKSNSNLIAESTKVYFNDVYDHILRVLESLDANREILSSLTEMHLSSVSNKTNEIVKTLTILAAIFIPVTFIAGIYGMNFDNMPELKWEYGYFIILIFMGLIISGLLFLFKKRGWL